MAERGGMGRSGAGRRVAGRRVPDTSPPPTRRCTTCVWRGAARQGGAAHLGPEHDVQVIRKRVHLVDRLHGIRLHARRVNEEHRPRHQVVVHQLRLPRTWQHTDRATLSAIMIWTGTPATELPLRACEALQGNAQAAASIRSFIVVASTWILSNPNQP